jgi:hypothetical protein
MTALTRARLESATGRFVVGILVTAALALLLIKQIYVNLLHIPRGAINGALAAAIGALALYAIAQIGRSKERGLVMLVLAHLACVAAVLLLSIASPHSIFSSQQLALAVLRYLLVPCIVLLPSLWRFPRLRDALPKALLIIQLLSTVFAASEVVGLPLGFLVYDDWLYQKLYNGLPRATGGVGTQIDLGFDSVLFMCFWLSYGQLRIGGRLIASAGFFLGLLSCIASFSRIYLMMAGVIALVGLLGSRLRRWALPILCAAAVAILAFNLGGAASFFGDLLLSRDVGSQSSNLDKEHTLRITAERADADGFWTGVGPGSQNGPTGNSKLIGDGYWPSIILELGFIPALFVLGFEIAILVHLFLFSGDSGAPMRIFVAGAVINSIFNSSYASLTAVPLFFVLSRYLAALRSTMRPAIQPKRFFATESDLQNQSPA